MGKKVADLIKEFNILPNELPIQKSDVWNLQSAFWQNQLIENMPSCNVPYSVKKEAIDAMFKTHRCVEERDIVYGEMPRVLEYFLAQRDVLLKDLSQVVNAPQSPSFERFRLGSIARLQYELTVIDAHLRQAYATFEKLLDLKDGSKPELPPKPKNLEQNLGDYTHVFQKEEEKAIEEILNEYENAEKDYANVENENLMSEIL